MNKRIFGIFVCMLLIATTLPQVIGIVNLPKMNQFNENEKIFINKINENFEHTINNNYNEKNIEIYTSEQLDQYQIEDDTSYKLYYVDNFDLLVWAQSFKPSMEVLSRVEVKLERHSDISTDIKLDIRRNLWHPALTGISKKANDIPSYPDPADWINFDFDDIVVTPGEIYFIVVSTSGGNIVSDYYTWRAGEEDPYLLGDMYVYGENDERFWKLYPNNNDFCFKTFGITNNPPDKPNIPIGPNHGIVNTYYDYSTSTIDPDGDLIEYKFDWGDGTYSDWQLNNKAKHQWNLPRTYNIRVKARDIHSAESLWSEPLNVIIANLDIMSVEPIQVVKGADLVQGKGTIFNVTLDSTFTIPIEAYFHLILNDEEWRYIPNLRDVTLDLPPDWKYPEIWGPVELEPGVNNIILPIVPLREEFREFDKDSFKVGLLFPRPEYKFLTKCSPIVRVVPRPIKPTVNFGIKVDPNEDYAYYLGQETGSNYYEGISESVNTTKPMTFYFVPWTWNFEKSPDDIQSAYEYYINENMGYTVKQYWLDHVEWILNNGNGYSVSLWEAVNGDDRDRLYREARSFIGYFLGTYPFNDSKVTFYIDNNLYFREEWLKEKGYCVCSFDKFEEYFITAIAASHPEVDQIIFLNIFGCCGTCKSNGVIYLNAGLELDNMGHNRWDHLLANPEKNPSDPDYYCLRHIGGESMIYGGTSEYSISHECAHKMLDAGECYKCMEADYFKTECNSCDTDSVGFWVNRWEEHNIGERYFMWDIDFRFRYWNRLEPTLNKSFNPNDDGYANALEIFTDVADPEVTLIRGKILKDGGVTFKPFIRLSDATVDVRLRDTGDYYFVLKDVNNKILSKSGFNLDFFTYDLFLKESKKVEETDFNYKLEWIEGTKSIEIQDRNGTVLSTKKVSSNKPEVKVVYPMGGERFRKNDTINVKWEASDNDGDNLTFILLFSNNSGEVWIPIDIDITGNEYEMSTTTFGTSEKCTIKVMVTDGVNTAEDTSDLFSLPKTKIYNPIMLLLQKILERFPFMVKILKQIIL